MLAFSNLRINGIDIWGESEKTNGGIDIYWTTDDIGSGCITIYKDKKGNIKIESGHMEKYFVIYVLDELAKMAEIVETKK